MAEECTATSSSTPINWWADVHASSWSTNTTNNNNTNTWNPTNPNSNSSCDEDHDNISMSNSFTNNASNHSGLSIDSSRRFTTNNNELIGSETASDHHLWNHVLLNVGSTGGLQNGQDVGENLINTYPPKNLATGLIFDPACDYLKKMDSGWEFSSSPAFNNFDKNFNGFNETIFENGRLSKLSNSVSNWSLAPPEPEMNRQFGQQPCNISLSSSTLDHQFPQSTVTEANINGLHSSYGHDETMKVEEHRQIEPLIRRIMINDGNGVGYQMGANSMNMGDNAKYYNNFPEMNYGSSLSKPFAGVTTPKSILKNNLHLSDCRKQSLQTSYPFQTTSSPCNTVSRSGRKGQLSNGNEGKKKRADYQDNLDTNSKKPKHDNSSAAVSKANVPKAKVADKITALQQIVSPFGKTDTASVLWEAIGYIKFLQDQVEQYCLNSPYMKNNSIKDPWGVDLKNLGEEKFDLKNRGLCLVPISRTPQVYRENSGSDFWTPAYRGCLYR